MSAHLGDIRRPRRVLFVEHNVDGTVGGSHYCLFDICRNIDRNLYTPVALFFQDNPLVPAFRDSGVEVLVGSPAAGLYESPPSVQRCLISLFGTLRTAVNAVMILFIRPVQWMRFLRHQRIDIIHLNNTFNGDHDLVLAAWLMRLPCIAHQRGLPGATGWTEMWFGRRLARTIAISNFVRDDLLRRGVHRDRVVLIHDGIDPERVVLHKSSADLLSYLRVMPTDRIVGIVGNVKSWKGQHVFLEAMGLVAARYPQVRGLIIGATPEPDYLLRLTELVTRFGLEANIVFTGYQRYPIDFMAIMEVVVHASVEPEPFGIVITEAMALGKPVVASALGGPLDIVEDGVTGFLTPADDAGSLAARILNLLDDPEMARRFGVAGTRRFEQLFTAKRNVAQIEALYAALPLRGSYSVA